MTTQVVAYFALIARDVIIQLINALNYMVILQTISLNVKRTKVVATVQFDDSVQKQQIVSLSSTEAEYRALCKVTAELTWLLRLLDEITAPISEKVIILLISKFTFK